MNLKNNKNKKNNNKDSTLNRILEQMESDVSRSMQDYQAEITTRETGRVFSVGKGVARIRGLSGVKYEELIRFEGQKMGIAFNLDKDEVAAVLLDERLEQFLLGDLPRADEELPQGFPGAVGGR